MDELAAKLVEWMSAFEAAVVEVAPKAAELALAYARVDAAGHLLVGLIGAAVLWLSVWSYLKHADFWFEKAAEVCGIPALTGISGALVAAINLLNIWNWVGLFYPELYLVRMALGG